MTSYFEDFKKSMKQRLGISMSLVKKHFNDVYFLVDVDFSYVQVVVPRVRWLRPLPYEINVDKAFIAITTLLAEEVDKKATAFGNYDLKTAYVMRKKKKIVKNTKEQFVEVEGDDEEDNEGDTPTQAPLSLT